MYPNRNVGQRRLAEFLVQAAVGVANPRRRLLVCGLERRKDPMSLNLGEKKAVEAEVAAKVAESQTNVVAE